MPTPDSVVATPKKSSKPVENQFNKEQIEESIEAADEAFRRKQSELRNRADKVSQTIGNASYLIDARPTNVIPRAALDKLPQKELMNLPQNWYFSRFYHTLNIIVDLFPSQREYEDAEVEERRKWCKKYKINYAALGPMNAITDIAPQLGLTK